MTKLSALTKVLCLIILTSAMIVSGWIIKFVILAFTLFLAVITPSGMEKTLRQLSSVKWFFLFLLVLNTLFSGDGIFTYMGFLTGVRITVNCITVIMLSSVLTSCTGAGDTADAVSLLLSPLKLVFFPVKQTALILSLSLQFIPMLTEEAERIRKAQRLRGVSDEGKGIIAKAKAMLSLVIPLFVIAFQRADRLALAMEARGIESAGDIRTSKHVRFSFRDVLALFISLLLLSGGIFL